MAMYACRQLILILLGSKCSLYIKNQVKWANQLCHSRQCFPWNISNRNIIADKLCNSISSVEDENDEHLAHVRCRKNINPNFHLTRRQNSYVMFTLGIQPACRHSGIYNSKPTKIIVVVSPITGKSPWTNINVRLIQAYTINKSRMESQTAFCGLWWSSL